MVAGDHLPVVYYTDEHLYSLQNNQKKVDDSIPLIELYTNMPTM